MSYETTRSLVLAVVHCAYTRRLKIKELLSEVPLIDETRGTIVNRHSNKLKKQQQQDGSIRRTKGRVPEGLP